MGVKGYDPFVERMQHRGSLRVTVLPPVMAEDRPIAATYRAAHKVPNIFNPEWLAKQSPEYRQAICRGRAAARKMFADATANPEEKRAHLAHAAEYERQGVAS